jgi:adenylate cyclase
MALDQKTKREFLAGLFTAILLSAGCMLLLANSRAGRWLEDGSLDWRQRLAQNKNQVDKRIVIIDVDNASLETLQEKLGRWPWTRRLWTEVIRYVNQGHPQAIAVDAIFSGAESDAVDSEFARVLKQQGNTVIGFTFLQTHIEQQPDAEEVEKQRLLESQQAVGGGPAADIDIARYVLNMPNAQLAESAAGLGALNALPDPDGVIRRVGLQYQYGGHTYDSLAARTVQQVDKQPVAWHQRNGLFDTTDAVVLGRRIPVDRTGKMLLLWHGGRDVYPRLPMWQMVCSIYPGQCPPTVEHIPPAYFRDRIVLIGASANASFDVHPTPFSPAAPGFLAHAAAIDNLLNGEAVRESPAWLVASLVIAMAAIGGVILFLQSHLSRGFVLMLVAALVYGVICYAAFAHWHFALPAVAPSLAIFLSFGSSTAARYITTGRQLRQTRGMLERYVAPQLVEYVIANLNDLKLNGDKRELTILVSDVRNFTSMTEKSDPLQIIALLNDYLSAMTEIIFRHNGIVDKFIGDGILAYWGAFTPEVNHADQAAQAALEMLTRVEELNRQWVLEGKDPIAIGIGIHTGFAIFGNIGKGKKIDFTVIGDAVNLASRLEGLNKEFRTSIIVSESTRERISLPLQTSSLGLVTVKGKTAGTEIYELQGGALPDIANPAVSGEPTEKKVI